MLIMCTCVNQFLKVEVVHLLAQDSLGGWWTTRWCGRVRPDSSSRAGPLQTNDKPDTMFLVWLGRQPGLGSLRESCPHLTMVLTIHGLWPSDGMASSISGWVLTKVSISSGKELEELNLEPCMAQPPGLRNSQTLHYYKLSLCRLAFEDIKHSLEL